MPLPSGRLLALLAGASVLFLVDAGWALLADAGLLALAALDWIATGGARFPVVARSPFASSGDRRATTPTITRGATGAVDLLVSNPGRWRLRLRTLLRCRTQTMGYAG